LVKHIKLDRAMMGLPFALISAFVAGSGRPRGWILLCAVVAAVAAGAAAEASHAYRRSLHGWGHWVLGLCLGLAPVGVWVAVRGGVEMAPVLLGGALLFWAAGFDLVAACKDIVGDREQGVFTVPARWGARKAGVMSAGSHVVAFWLLAIFGEVAGLGWLYLSGVVLLVPVLYLLHRMAGPEDWSRGKGASFVAADVLSMVLLLFAAADVIVLGGRMPI